MYVSTDSIFWLCWQLLGVVIVSGIGLVLWLFIGWLVDMNEKARNRG